jgi:hypothetical protein
MLSKVIEVSVVGPFALLLRFADGSAGRHDFSSLIASRAGPMVEPLRDPSYFARVFLEFGAPTWPNGFDMCPDWLRMEMQAAGGLGASAVE